MPERLAALKVAPPGELHWRRDLCVGLSGSTIVALRAVHDAYEDDAPFHEMPWTCPAETPSQRDWRRGADGRRGHGA